MLDMILISILSALIRDRREGVRLPVTLVNIQINSLNHELYGAGLNTSLKMMKKDKHNINYPHSCAKGNG